MRSGSDEAWRWGTPMPSRRTVTGVASPGSCTSPSTCGSARCDQRQYTAAPASARRASASTVQPRPRRRRRARGAGAGGGVETAAAVVMKEGSLTRLAADAIGTDLGDGRQPLRVAQADAVTAQHPPVFALARAEGLQGRAVGV